MFDFGTKHLTDRTRIGIVAIARHLARKLSYNGDRTTKEPLGSHHVARRTEQRVDQVAFMIDGTVQVAPFCPGPLSTSHRRTSAAQPYLYVRNASAW